MLPTCCFGVKYVELEGMLSKAPLPCHSLNTKGALTDPTEIENFWPHVHGKDPEVPLAKVFPLNVIVPSPRECGSTP